MKILTWNISLTKSSDQAPDDWHHSINIHEMHKIIEEGDPDIFSLQEMPTQKFGKRFVDYHQIGPVPSHSGFVGVFVRKHFEILGSNLQPPSIIVELATSLKQSFYFVGTHLAPYKENATRRLQQMGVIMQTIPDSHPIIIAGDMNMREDETSAMLSSYGLDDAYLLTTQSKENRFTWDSRINLYHDSAPPFVCRFDRVFLRNVKVESFGLIGKKPASENPHHFLSDHFGIVAEIEILANT